MIIFECRKTPCAKYQRITHTVPGRRRLRCAPTQRPDRWCSVRYALERQHAVDIPLVATDVTGLSANLSPQFGCFQGHEGMHGRTPYPVASALKVCHPVEITDHAVSASIR
jgi:hypothetical protein